MRQRSATSRRSCSSGASWRSGFTPASRERSQERVTTSRRISSAAPARERALVRAHEQPGEPHGVCGGVQPEPGVAHAAHATSPQPPVALRRTAFRGHDGPCTPSSGEERHEHPLGQPHGQRRDPHHRGRAATAARPLPARGARPHRHARRLRHVQLRRVHRAPRRRGRQVAARCSPSRRTAPRSRRSRAWATEGELHPAAGGVLGAPRPAVRLLHAGHDHGLGRPAAAQPEARPRRRSARRWRATSAAAPATTTSSRRCSARPQGAVMSRRGPRRQRENRGSGTSRIKRKEDPRLITGRGALHRRHQRPRAAVGGVRPLARGAREASSRSTRPPPRRATASCAVFTGEDIDLGGAAADGLGPARRRRQQPAALAAGQGQGQHVGDPVAVVIGARPLRASSTPPRRSSVEYDPLPVVVDLEAALKDDDARPRRPRHEQVPRVVAGRRGPRGGLRGGRRDRRAPRSSTTAPRARAIEPRGVLADYRAGELTLTRARPRSRTSCGCSSAHPARRSARTASASIAPEVGGGFGSKLQIYGEEVAARAGPRASSSGRSSGSRRAPRTCSSTHHGRDQIAYVRMGAKRDGTITAFHAEDPRGPRRLPDAADADDPVARRVRDERLSTRSRPSRPTSSASSRTRSRPTRSAARAAPRPRT